MASGTIPVFRVKNFRVSINLRTGRTSWSGILILSKRPGVSLTGHLCQNSSSCLKEIIADESFIRAGNPPDLSQAYVLQDEDGNPTYEKLMSGNSTNLIGLDQDCTGMNDTSLSEQYYARGNGTSKSSSTSVSAAPTAKPTPKTYGTASPSTTATPPKGTKKSSAIHHFSSRSTFLMGLVIAHSFGRLF